MRFVTLGVGAQNSPRYAPAGLLVSCAGAVVAIDGGPGAEPPERVDAWVVTDDRAELIAPLRRLAARRGLTPAATSVCYGDLVAECLPVVHTSHSTFGFLLHDAAGRVAVWAPEFLEFPGWAKAADLMFAEAAAWNRPIRFRGRAGGHLDVLAVAEAARTYGVRRLVFAHIGRPTIRALDRGERPPFGEFAHDRQVFWLRGPAARSSARVGRLRQGR
jgi:hypothetical protein